MMLAADFEDFRVERPNGMPLESLRSMTSSDEEFCGLAVRDGRASCRSGERLGNEDGALSV